MTEESGETMERIIRYSCVSDVGAVREENQDNFVCDGIYMDRESRKKPYSKSGRTQRDGFRLFGVFDGMGGEECGEVASFLAARDAAEMKQTKEPLKELKDLCIRSNRNICRYAEENNIFSTGTTAALLAFSEKAVFLCNIGDSKVFRCNRSGLKQLSVDHLMPAPAGRKSDLSQNLGIPEDAMIIEPYVAEIKEEANDVFVICSDGLTDMVSAEEMQQVIGDTKVEDLAGKLVDAALKNGGRDNVTVIALQA